MRESCTSGSVRGARGNSRPYRNATATAVGLAALHMSAYGRYCCKSPKLPGPKFLAVKKSDLRPPIDVAPITLPRSSASLSSGNEVPHIFTRESRLRPKEFLISSAKRLLQQNLSQPDSCTAAKDTRYSITSSARCWSCKGTPRPSALAVFILITSSNLTGAWTGSSPGFAPFRMRSA